jgi:uncharacterized protein (DUF305 family)
VKTTETVQRAALSAGAFALAFALTACGDNATTGRTGTAPASSSASTGAEAPTEAHNDADVTFAQGMIVHHRGAIAMADLAAERAENPQVQDLAERISAAQGPEIDTMTSWLEAWGEDVPEGMSMESASSGGHGGMGEETSAAGRDMEASMAELEAAPAGEFDRMFLEMMIEHHQGAVEMAQTEQAEGENPEAVELAQTIETDQTQEIQEMQQLLQTV